MRIILKETLPLSGRDVGAGIAGDGVFELHARINVGALDYLS